jgi:hypothetical protein
MSSAPTPAEDPEPCTGCGNPVEALAVFPGGVCLDCWARSPEGRRMPTADEVTAMWGGPVRTRNRDKKGPS